MTREHSSLSKLTIDLPGGGSVKFELRKSGHLALQALLGKGKRRPEEVLVPLLYLTTLRAIKPDASYGSPAELCRAGGADLNWLADQLQGGKLLPEQIKEVLKHLRRVEKTLKEQLP